MYEPCSSVRETANEEKKAHHTRVCDVRFLHTVVKRQRTEEGLAFIGLGELQLDEKYTDKGIKESIFYRKTRAHKRLR